MKPTTRQILKWYRKFFGGDGSSFKDGPNGTVLYLSPSGSKWKPVNDHKLASPAAIISASIK